MDQQSSQQGSSYVRTPGWWNEGHASAWDRVKDAFRRDWEQTRVDFASKNARNLNQGVSDTLKQVFGTAHIPPPGTKTHPSDPEKAVKEADAARERMIQTAEDAEKRMSQATTAIADASRTAATDIAKERTEVAEAATKRDDAAARWRQVEAEARYGFAVRTQRPNDVWNDALEASLRTEWIALNHPGTWEDARPAIRRGWEYANRAR